MKKFGFSLLIVIAAISFFSARHPVFASNNTYTVQQGDSLSSIALAKLHDENKWEDIYNLNKSVIGDPNIIYPGSVISIPVESTQTRTAPVSVVLSSDAGKNDPVITQKVTVKQVPAFTPATPPVVLQPVVSAGAYMSIINAAAAKYHVSASVMANVIRCESGFNPNARNPSGAYGIAQFMPGTYYGSWNIYRNQYDISSPVGQIYAMALKISEGDANAWVCYQNLYG